MATGGKALGVVFSEQDFDAVTTDDLTVTGTFSVPAYSVEDLTVSDDLTVGGDAAVTGLVAAATITASSGLTTNAFSSTGTSAIGNAAGDTIGMYGATPVVQRATAGSHTVIATTVAVSTTSAIWGFSTSTQANAAIAAIAELQATVLALGIWAA